MSKMQGNTWIRLFIAIKRFYAGTIEIFWGMIYNKNQKIQNHDFPTLNHIIRNGPQDFWKNPTAIKMGRALPNFLLKFFRGK